jgi:hypothetical protein
VTRPRSLWYALLAAFLSSLLMGGVAIQYADWVNRRSERKWCHLIVLLDRPYTERAPQSELGKAIAEALHKLRRDFGC